MSKGGEQKECEKTAVVTANKVTGEPENKAQPSLLEEDNLKIINIKATGDWELDVLAAPFGDEFNKDADDEYFSKGTNFYLDNYKPPAFYYHGFDETGNPMGEPALIGKTESAQVKEDGVWLRVILDKANEFAQKVWEAAKQGLARASSGSIYHLVRKKEDGEITNWPLAEISIFDINGNMQPANQYAVAIPVMKLNLEKAGMEAPEWAKEEVKGESKELNQEQEEADKKAKTIEKENEMSEKIDEKTLAELVKEQVAAELKAEKEKLEAQAAREAEIEVAKAEAIKAEREKMKDEYLKNKRLPFEEAPTVAKFSELWKYDNLESGDIALMIDVLNTASVKGKKNSDGRRVEEASENMYKALALRLADSKDQKAFKMLERKVGKALKSDEIMYSTLSSYGDDWVGVEYSRQLWENIRVATPILGKIPQMEIPQGYESATIPLESTDMTWYKVAQAEDHSSSRPSVTVTASQVGTSNKNIPVAKLGARVDWTGELSEDSLILIMPEIRRKMIVSGAEQLENAIINGDDATATVTNINDIAGTPAGTEVFMVWDGFRRTGLNSNYRDAGSHDVDDYIDTLKLMGSAGINALDINKTAFVIGPQEYWSLMKEEDVKTQDVFSKATLEKGNIVALWGRELVVSGQMCAASSDRLSNTSGLIDVDTTTNNTKGTILAVRWDQWKFAWKRRMTLETDRWPESDTNMMVAMFRCGLAPRSNDACAIAYNVTV